MAKMAKEKMCSHRVGLTLGIFFAFLHAVWALMVALNVAKSFMDWIMPLHFIDMAMSFFPFNLMTAILLVIITFVCGYVMGWLFAFIYNKLP